ncbi:cholesterol oxidase substrate-binding domain-containing protein [Cryptosporangium aurantiacum]|uniref:FAD binding domain-containing protein n=1 Tax=Cryptosporangium aurantiacum TaxID=134849 RepID=A0A1M7RAU9_9ACTN|nr:cholesterol oxidase substrate-binding domain-containing protein [Cryptosporangium aurantiacum]SHN43321.1 FAD binding domain-containing protein [Cryptosporangium aurantiacum]
MGSARPFDRPLHRRTVLRGAAALAAAGFAGEAFTLPAAAATIPAPPSFPAGIELYQQAYVNWSGEIDLADVWTCAPATPADVVTVANWARANGYRVRPKGMSHGWAPTLLPAGADVTKVVLVDLTKHLRGISVGSGRVTVQAGATIDQLTVALENAGYGLAALTAPGNLTVGGVLAIGAHGSAVPANGETRIPGTSYGTLSNLVLSLTVVAWDATAGAYVLKTYTRTQPQIAAFLVHLGRAFVVSAVLQVGANTRLRCQSFYDIPTATLFAAPGTSGRTIESYLARSGRIEAIWFPFTDRPWLKVWTIAPSKPVLSRSVSAPYAYTFANFLSEEQSDFLSRIVAGDTSGTPAFENFQISVVGSGLIVTGTWDIWGWSKNLLLYVQPTTLRIVEAGYAVLTSRANVQRVIHEFYVRYQARISAYQAQGKFPMNGPVEIRVTGVDTPADVSGGGVSPQLSAARPRPDRPDWNAVVWLDMGTIPGTPDADSFYAEMESWIVANYSGDYATVRPEWSKAWAVTPAGAWTDTAALTGRIPAALRAGQPAGDNWDTARATLNAADPHRIFSNTFLDTLLP